MMMMTMRAILAFVVLAASTAAPPPAAAAAPGGGGSGGGGGGGGRRLPRLRAGGRDMQDADEDLIVASSEEGIELFDTPQTEPPMMGTSYCTYAPDWTCYDLGWPGCCLDDEDGRCPIDQPPCEVTATTAITTTTTFTTTTTSTDPDDLGSSYCTWSPDFTCYEGGWPECCNDGRCPIEKPACDVAMALPADGVDVEPSMETAVPAYCNAAADFTCYPDAGIPSCCLEDDPASSCISEASPPCDDAKYDSSMTSSSAIPASYDEIPVSAFPPLQLPPGGLRKCDEIIQSEDNPDGMVPGDIVTTLLTGAIGAFDLGAFTDLALGLVGASVIYDVRVRKICATCEDANALWEEQNACEEEGGEVCHNAGDVMPYCREGSFASGRTTSGLLFEPIDPATGRPVVGRVATTIYSYPTDTNPFLATSQTWPASPLSDTNAIMGFLGPLASASSGNYVVVPDVLGNGEDWENTRSYIVKSVYQASAVPLLFKAREFVARDNEGEGKCNASTMDGRLNIVGYSEGGYASASIAHAIDMLGGDYWVHGYTGLGGAPLRVSTAQLYMTVEMEEGTYPFPQFAARIGNAYSSTNQDLVNTNLTDMDVQQPLASEEYLNPYDGTKDVREWAKAGLSYVEMTPLMPGPPYGAGKQSDILNPELVDMIVQSFNAGNDDFCNSEYATDSVDKLCEAMKDNDLLDIVESMDYPVTICHSADDELVYYSNAPDTEAHDHLSMIEDIPLIGEFIRPSGSHRDAALQCTLGFLIPYTDPPETSAVRGVRPVDDPDGTCADDGVGAAVVVATTPSTVVATTPSTVVATTPSTVVVPGGATVTTATSSTTASSAAKDPPPPSDETQPTSAGLAASTGSISVAAIMVTLFSSAALSGRIW